MGYADVAAALTELQETQQQFVSLHKRVVELEEDGTADAALIQGIRVFAVVGVCTGLCMMCTACAWYVLHVCAHHKPSTCGSLNDPYVL